MASKRPTGRPTAYTEEIADTLIQGLSSGLSLAEICRRDDMPARSTVHLWIAQDRDGLGFSDRYAKACEIRAHILFDEMFEIADNGSNDWMEREGLQQANPEAIARSRLRVDTRKWALSKMIPKTFGDKIDVDNRSSDGSMSPTDVSAKAAAALAKQLKG